MPETRNIQKELQRVHQEKIVPQLQQQVGDEYVGFLLTREEADDLNDFLNMFLYD